MDSRKEIAKREGERRKGEAFANLEAHREAILRKARRAFVTALLANGRATIDDVRSEVVLPPGMNPICFGPVASPFARLKFVHRIGFAETTRPEAHCRPVGVWETTSTTGLTNWLATHPEITANETGSTDATAEPALNINTNPPTNGVNDNGQAQ